MHKGSKKNASFWEQHPRKQVHTAVSCATKQKLITVRVDHSSVLTKFAYDETQFEFQIMNSSPDLAPNPSTATDYSNDCCLSFDSATNKRFHFSVSFVLQSVLHLCMFICWKKRQKNQRKKEMKTKQETGYTKSVSIWSQSFVLNMFCAVALPHLYIDMLSSSSISCGE